MSYPKPALAVDLALITVSEGYLNCLLMLRADAEKVGGKWALPGGYVRIDEEIHVTAQRVLREKVGIGPAYLEQLFTYGAIERDPRERVVSVTHLALMPSRDLLAAVEKSASLELALVQTDWAGEGSELRLAFDHSAILGDVVKRLRGKLEYTNIALELLPQFFTLRQAQEVYEAILGRKLTKPAFRRKLLDRNIIKATGQREEASAFRPAELYTRL